ncbi:MAG: UDP-N-acetylmuramoyl-L-alanine--D-glutamate ligase, partial [Candidatus Eisenbacteria bacterium]|nr:UDP-N-acetylmuramoyl-L-alanine--D-glutamate ligase [Candidatus Eisenbacteria bacterium]
LGLRLRHEPPCVAVLGLARSGWAAASLLAARTAARLLLLDRVPGASTEERMSGLRRSAHAVELRAGEHDAQWLDEIDLIIKSPGVDPRAPFVQAAVHAGVPVVGELELGALAARGPIGTISGTNGKSTTTAWTGDMMRRSGVAVQVVGNIGRPICEGVQEDPDAVFVAEVSSFQLEDSSRLHPRVATLLNLSPDHLDRHESFAAYRAAKLRMFQNQTAKDVAVLGDGPEMDELARVVVPARCLRVQMKDRGAEGCVLRDDRIWIRDRGLEVPLQPRARLSLPGRHNLENAMAAAATAHALGATPDAIAASLADFGGLPHRLEHVGTIAGIECINDSKATNVGSLEVALQAFDRPVRLIAGGVPKGQGFAPLATLVAQRTSGVYLIGEAAAQMEREWSTARSIRCPSLEAALDAALEDARVGDRILLSPGCASFDMFRDYEDRGDRFRALVQERVRERDR